MDSIGSKLPDSLRLGQVPSSQAITIIRMPDLEIFIGLKRSNIYDRLDPKSSRYDPDFPKPVSLGPRAIGFIHAEVQSWLRSRIDASRNPEARQGRKAEVRQNEKAVAPRSCNTVDRRGRHA